MLTTFVIEKGDFMILGIGIDLLNIDRIEKIYNKFEEKFTKRVLATEEVELYNVSKNKINFLAKRFCAKEAFSKAIGIGIGRGINMPDIIIKKDILGKPSILLSDNAYTFIEKYYDKERELIHINLSISDESPFVNSFVVISSIDTKLKVETI